MTVPPNGTRVRTSSQESLLRLADELHLFRQRGGYETKVVVVGNGTVVSVTPITSWGYPRGVGLAVLGGVLA